MGFGVKIRKLREAKGWTQQELGDMIGMSTRTICAYENENIRPRKRETYNQLSELFDVNVNYLLTDEESFIFQAHNDFGKIGMQEATELINGVIGLFAGGDLTLEDKKAVLDTIEEAYYDAKHRETERKKKEGKL
ncbi:MAG: helix-turn-helix domain-containing protein [Ezakiella massiliensis]|uniref:helix-turn-helix domain-containing protein n=1 Tax=Ezakiella TaxID=1582879 RepID=UPI00094EC0C2|nr:MULTISPECIES: helix-turn-helix transcriptional regulator [Ezakiella]